jgi:exosome complex RNA-binding protein Rrp42 (RNase PH superfamily)
MAKQYTMKYAHTFDSVKDVFPQFWEKEHFQVALKRLNTAKMSPVDRALFENTLMRIKTVADAHQEEIKIASEKAAVQAIENTKIATIQKSLLGGKLSIEEIADYNNVAVDIVKKIKKNMQLAEKRKAKTPKKEA